MKFSRATYHEFVTSLTFRTLLKKKRSQVPYLMYAHHKYGQSFALTIATHLELQLSKAWRSKVAQCHHIMTKELRNKTSKDEKWLLSGSSHSVVLTYFIYYSSILLLYNFLQLHDIPSKISLNSSSTSPRFHRTYFLCHYWQLLEHFSATKI